MGTMVKFNFYNAYLDEMNKLNPFQFKKLINALAVYTEKGTLPNKLSNKAMSIFTEIQRVISAEKSQEILSEIRSKAGKKGAKKRWQ
jgi:hypothetical protein